mmetsp:Transcript_45477/g.120544  ORF Transcript_45477/g.120544 Transcript_45477/m.120544 type:complete len:567 (-) Transcript_45477:885-2585(-)
MPRGRRRAQHTAPLSARQGPEAAGRGAGRGRRGRAEDGAAAGARGAAGHDGRHAAHRPDPLGGEDGGPGQGPHGLHRRHIREGPEPHGRPHRRARARQVGGPRPRNSVCGRLRLLQHLRHRALSREFGYRVRVHLEGVRRAWHDRAPAVRAGPGRQPRAQQGLGTHQRISRPQADYPVRQPQRLAALGAGRAGGRRRGGGHTAAGCEKAAGSLPGAALVDRQWIRGHRPRAVAQAHRGPPAGQVSWPRGDGAHPEGARARGAHPLRHGRPDRGLAQQAALLGRGTGADPVALVPAGAFPVRAVPRESRRLVLTPRGIGAISLQDDVAVRLEPLQKLSQRYAPHGRRSRPPPARDAAADRRLVGAGRAAGGNGRDPGLHGGRAVQGVRARLPEAGPAAVGRPDPVDAHAALPARRLRAAVWRPHRPHRDAPRAAAEGLRLGGAEAAARLVRAAVSGRSLVRRRRGGEAQQEGEGGGGGGGRAAGGADRAAEGAAVAGGGSGDSSALQARLRRDVLRPHPRVARVLAQGELPTRIHPPAAARRHGRALVHLAAVPEPARGPVAGGARR